MMSSNNKAARWLRWTEHAVATGAVLYCANYVRQRGIKAVLGDAITAVIKAVPGAKGAMDREMQAEVDKTVAEMFEENEQSRAVPQLKKLPKQGVDGRVILSYLQALQSLDSNSKDGQLFAYVYELDEDEGDHDEDDGKAKMTHQQVVHRAVNLFMHKNPLNPSAFPSLRRFENDVVAMTLNLLNAPASGRGVMTSGGTESIFMAMKAYRDRGRELHGITRPNIVVPLTAHVAFDKAGHFLGFEVRHARVRRKSLMVDVDSMEALIDDNTVALVASAPQYPHGIIDPIREIGRVAQERGLPLHVDACVGGFMLPWVERLGFRVPKFDFRVPGVTSMSADLHKYGFAAKGASTLLFRSDDYRRFQLYSCAGWPGGLFVSPSMLGTRNGGLIAGAWAAMLSMGESGYLEIARGVMETSKFVQEGIKGIPGIELLGEPAMTIVAFHSTRDDLNIYCVADIMEDEFGWKLERQQNPACCHLSLMPVHAKIKRRLVDDLRTAVTKATGMPAKSGSAAMYGNISKIPSNAIVEDFLKQFLLKVYAQ